MESIQSKVVVVVVAVVVVAAVVVVVVVLGLMPGLVRNRRCSFGLAVRRSPKLLEYSEVWNQE